MDQPIRLVAHWTGLFCDQLDMLHYQHLHAYLVEILEVLDVILVEEKEYNFYHITPYPACLFLMVGVICVRDIA